MYLVLDKLKYTLHIIKVMAPSVAEPEPHHLVGAGAVTRCGSGSDGSGFENGIKDG
jgi:hypothetical protein